MKINFDSIDLVEDWYDEDYGHTTMTRTYYICGVCAAVVATTSIHESWHNED